jgi:hypothetical protein
MRASGSIENIRRKINEIKDLAVLLNTVSGTNLLKNKDLQYAMKVMGEMKPRCRHLQPDITVGLRRRRSDD